MSENGGAPSGDNSATGNPAGNGGSANSSAANGEGGGNWTSTFSEDNRGYIAKKGWQNADAVVQSYRELESRQSRDASYPNNPLDYKFTMPEGINPEGFYDQKFADTFKEWSYQAKIGNDKAQSIHDSFVRHAQQVHAEQQQAANDTRDKMVSGAHDGLVEAWGNPETPQFQRNIEMSRRAIEQLDPNLKQSLIDHGIIAKHTDDDGKTHDVVMNAPIMKALAKVGNQMFAEDAVFGSKPQGENPFAPENARKPGAMARMGELVNNDLELAKTLIRAAGVEKQWQHVLNK